MTPEQHKKRREEAAARKARVKEGQKLFSRVNHPGTLASGQGNRRRGAVRGTR